MKFPRLGWRRPPPTSVDRTPAHSLSPADRRIDMAIPESFHRLKRTLLLFATGLIVLEIAALNGAPHLKFPLIDDADIPIWIARLMLLAATLYYAIGFWLEAETARRVNTEAFDRGAQSVNAALQTIADRFKWRDGSMGPDQALQSAVSLLETLLREHEKLLSEIKPRLVEKLTHELESRRSSDAPALIAQRIAGSVLAKNSMHPERTPDAAVAQLMAAIKPPTEALIKLMDQVAKADRSITRLSNSITGSRKVSFFGWEIGLTAAYVLSAVGLSINGAVVSGGIVLYWLCPV